MISYSGDKNLTWPGNGYRGVPKGGLLIYKGGRMFQQLNYGISRKLLLTHFCDDPANITEFEVTLYSALLGKCNWIGLLWKLRMWWSLWIYTLFNFAAALFTDSIVSIFFLPYWLVWLQNGGENILTDILVIILDRYIFLEHF